MVLTILRPRERLGSIVMSTSVCFYLSSVYLRGYLLNHMLDLYQIVGACCLLPWLGPPASFRYVIYFRFCG